MYNRGMTVPESKTTSTASTHRTGSAGRKHLGAHLPAENRSWRIVNKQKEDVDTQTSDSEHTSRRNGKHTRSKASEQLEMISAPSTGRMSCVPTSALTWRMISATANAQEDDEMSS